MNRMLEVQVFLELRVSSTPKSKIKFKLIKPFELITWNWYLLLRKWDREVWGLGGGSWEVAFKFFNHISSLGTCWGSAEKAITFVQKFKIYMQFICTFYAVCMHFLCSLYALFVQFQDYMHFICAFYAVSTDSYALCMQFWKAHKKRIKTTYKLRRKFIPNFPKFFQNFIKNHSNLWSWSQVYHWKLGHK